MLGKRNTENADHHKLSPGKLHEWAKDLKEKKHVGEIMSWQLAEGGKNPSQKVICK